MEEKIINLIADQFHMSRDQLSPDMSFKDDLDADSIELVELIMTLEEEFDIEVEDESLENIETIGDVIEALESYV